MLYVTDIEIPDRLSSDAEFNFGDVFQKIVVLPAKIRKIRSFCCFAELDICSKMKHLEITDENETTTKKDVLSAQVASLSMCLNKTNTIMANSPVYAVDELHDTSFKGNKVDFDASIDVPSGSTLLLTVEEKEDTPFATSELYYTYNQPRRNKYTVKIYLEYDK